MCQSAVAFFAAAMDGRPGSLLDLDRFADFKSLRRAPTSLDDVLGAIGRRGAFCHNNAENKLSVRGYKCYNFLDYME